MGEAIALLILLIVFIHTGRKIGKGKNQYKSLFIRTNEVHSKTSVNVITFSLVKSTQFFFNKGRQFIQESNNSFNSFKINELYLFDANLNKYNVQFNPEIQKQLN